MSYFLILNPHRVKEFLKVNEPFLRALVKEPPRTNKRGRKRIAERWVIVTLVAIARIEGIAWIEEVERDKNLLSFLSFLLKEMLFSILHNKKSVKKKLIIKSKK